jgi:Protein of unknown function (DUF2909)
MDLIRIVAIGLLLAIVISMGSALFHLSSNRGPPTGVQAEEHSRKMARALTIRVGLSISLFILLMLAWKMGWIVPHGVGH